MMKTIFILSLFFIFVPTFTAAQTCSPYLIDNDALTAILKSNIGNAPLSNARALAKTDSNCQIELTATINVLGTSIRGCTTPIHKEYEIGLSSFVLDTALGKFPVSVGYSDIKNKIIAHCGALQAISGLRVDDTGVSVLF